MTNAKLSKISAGQIVWLDNGFTCHDGGAVPITENPSGLCFKCTAGNHYLDWQLQSDGDTLVGVYLLNTQENG
jgi:hypothetical protein